MLELTFQKSTDKALRWGIQYEDAKLQIYISRWRVPELLPKRIYVEINESGAIHSKHSQITERDINNNPSLATRIITAFVKKDEDKLHTIRYRPLGDNEEMWEIRETYIPKGLTSNHTSTLKITIHWVKPANF